MIQKTADCMLLNNGRNIPWLGFGVFLMMDDSKVMIPKSVHLECIVGNSRIFDVELSAVGMSQLDSLDQRRRPGPDPASFDF